MPRQTQDTDAEAHGELSPENARGRIASGANLGAR